MSDIHQNTFKINICSAKLAFCIEFVSTIFQFFIINKYVVLNF